MMKPLSSILSFKVRGQGGNNNYSGNYAPQIPETLIEIHSPTFVVDVCCGSDTTGDVCLAMGISYEGFDLHSGFDVTNHSLKKAIKIRRGAHSAPDLIFAHIPYHDMKVYSGEEWGDEPVAGDLSRCATPGIFISEIFWMIKNCLHALAPGGSLYIIVGDQRNTGNYRAFEAYIVAMEAAPLKKILIKEQHNCSSDYKPIPAYFPKDYIPIRHEYILGFKKAGKMFSCGTRIFPHMNLPQKEKSFFGTWRDVVNVALLDRGNRATTQQIYDFVSAHVAIHRSFLREKIRQTLNAHFRKLRTGYYCDPNVPITP